MGFKCGIVGLPNVGKSTLFNALTNTASAAAANYPFCTIEPNVGNVPVPDTRLYELQKAGGSKTVIATQLQFVDIAGIVRGASKGEGLGNQILANIREVDAICHVFRCFEEDDITRRHAAGEGALGDEADAGGGARFDPGRRGGDLRPRRAPPHRTRQVRCRTRGSRCPRWI